MNSCRQLWQHKRNGDGHCPSLSIVIPVGREILVLWQPASWIEDENRIRTITGDKNAYQRSVKKNQGSLTCFNYAIDFSSSNKLWFHNTRSLLYMCKHLDSSKTKDTNILWLDSKSFQSTRPSPVKDSLVTLTNFSHQCCKNKAVLLNLELNIMVFVMIHIYNMLCIILFLIQNQLTVRNETIVTLWYNQKGWIFNHNLPENSNFDGTFFYAEITHPSTVSLLLGHSISLAGWFISQQVRKVLASWLLYSTILTIGVRLIYRVSIYKHLISYLMT